MLVTLMRLLEKRFNPMLGRYQILGFGLVLTLSVSVQAMEKAPTFQLEDVEGQRYDLGKNLGKEVILLDFWATYCLPCLAEMNTFKDLETRYHDRGFRVVAIAVDQPQTLARVRAFAKARAFPFPILIDPSQDAYRLYGVSALPTSMLIDRKGFVAHRQEGFQPGEEATLESRIVELLGDTVQRKNTPDSLSPTVTSGTAFLPQEPPNGFSNVTLSGTNFLRANYGREKRDQLSANGWLEDWFDIRASNGKLAYQVRYRTYQFLENLPGAGNELIRDPNHRIVKQNLAFTGERAILQAGNIYGNVGRGLLFRFFEDRMARLDKDLNGFRAGLESGSFPGLGQGRFSLFGGKTYSRFPDLHSVDAEEDAFRDLYLQGIEGGWEFGSHLKTGAQYAEAFRKGWNVKMIGGNGEWLSGPTDLYLGYMDIQGEDKFNYPNSYAGRALYASLSENLGNLEAGAEYKYYHNYDLGFTDPPSLVQYHTFRLMARDMLFPNNQAEEGLQLHGAWHFHEASFYATNLSRITSHPERNPSLLIHHVELPYLDWNHQLRLPWPNGGSSLLDLNWNNQKKFSEGNFEDVQAYSLGLTGEKPVGVWSIEALSELQYRDIDFRSLQAGDPVSGRLGEPGKMVANLSTWQGVASATLGRSSLWSLTLDYEATTSGLEQDRNSPVFVFGDLRNGWGSAYATYSLTEGHKISLWAGQRKERVVCAGGSCRLEPAFEGTELIWTSHF
jgi:peroxiredoxin